MGFPLYREIRDFAPPDWSSGELVVALMIADDANDGTRISWIPNAELCYRTRMRESALRGKLTSLAVRGFEFRIVQGHDKHGRPVFATKGHAVTYLVPDMFKGAVFPAALPVDNQSGGGLNDESKAPGFGAYGTGNAAAKSLKGAWNPAPLSSKNNNNLTHSSPPAGPVVTAPVEGARATGQVNGDFLSADEERQRAQAEELRRQSAALWEFERQQRGNRESE